jgi:fumarylpyruvate hydrolase
MNYAIKFPATPTLPVAESTQVFPVGRIYCVGRNYAEHAREMGHDPDREPPFFFMKPADAIVQNGTAIPYPQVTKDLHHEIEMIVAIGKDGANIPVEKALDHVFGYGVGLDMTRRDLQGEAKKMGRPWEMGKAFDNSAPCTALKPISMVGHPAKGAIWLECSGNDRVFIQSHYAARGRRHHVGYTGRRGPGEGRRQARGTCGRRRRSDRHLHQVVGTR